MKKLFNIDNKSIVRLISVMLLILLTIPALAQEEEQTEEEPKKKKERPARRAKLFPSLVSERGL